MYAAAVETEIFRRKLIGRKEAACFMTTHDLPLPLVSLGGTHPRDLYDQLTTALCAVVEARRVLREAAPNGRDYPGTTLAGAQHRARERESALDEVVEDLKLMLTHVVDTGGSRI